MRNPVWQTLMGICLLMMTALLSWRAGRLEPAREAAVGTLGEKVAFRRALLAETPPAMATL